MLLEYIWQRLPQFLCCSQVVLDLSCGSKHDRISKSWLHRITHNHRRAEAGRDFWRLPAPNPAQEHQEQFAQDHIQEAFEDLQGRRLRNLSGKPVQVLSHLRSKEQELIYVCV